MMLPDLALIFLPLVDKVVVDIYIYIYIYIFFFYSENFKYSFQTSAFIVAGLPVCQLF